MEDIVSFSRNDFDETRSKMRRLVAFKPPHSDVVPSPWCCSRCYNHLSPYDHSMDDEDES
jgi:hypothetical protein